MIIFFHFINTMLQYCKNKLITYCRTGPSVQSYYGKRSLPDGADSLDFNWTRIIQILHEMDEHFRRLGAQKSEDDCRKILICKLIESNDIQYLNDNQSKLVKLTNELR